MSSTHVEASDREISSPEPSTSELGIAEVIGAKDKSDSKVDFQSEA